MVAGKKKRRNQYMLIWEDEFSMIHQYLVPETYESAMAQLRAMKTKGMNVTILPWAGPIYNPAGKLP